MSSISADQVLSEIWKQGEVEYPGDRTKIELRIFHRLFGKAEKDFTWLGPLTKQLSDAVMPDELRLALEKQKLTLVDPDFIVDSFVTATTIPGTTQATAPPEKKKRSTSPRPAPPAKKSRAKPPPSRKPVPSKKPKTGSGEILYFNDYKRAKQVAQKLASDTSKSVVVQRSPRDDERGVRVFVPPNVKRDFLDAVGSIAEELVNHRVAVGTFAATLMMLMDSASGYQNIPDDSLVLEAFRRSDSELANASASEIAAHFSEYTSEQQQGVISNVKGIYHELAFVQNENIDGDEWTANIMPSTNHPGVDVVMINSDNGEVLELQLKATDSVSYVTSSVESVPEGTEVLATQEVASKLADVESSGLTNEEVSGEVAQVAESLNEGTGETVAGELLDGLLTGGVVTGAITVAKHAAKDEPIESDSLITDLAKVGFRVVLISLGLSFF